MEELLHKYLNDETLTASELKSLRAHPEYASYLKIATQSNNYLQPEFDKTALYQKIKAAQSPSSAHKEKTIAPKSKQRSSRNWFAIAASFLLLIAAGFYFSNNQSIPNISTQVAEQTTLELPDGSVVFLNSESSISFDEKNWETERKVTLNGQAFFKVETGKQFTVLTTQGAVKVLGTQFNVNDREDIFQVSCYEGKVSVTSAQQEQIITQGQRAQLINNSLVLSDITATLPSWINGESSFENTAFSQVIAELQRQYAVTVTYDDRLKNVLFTGAFTHENLEVALKSISSTMGTNYTINGDQVVLTQ